MKWAGMELRKKDMHHDRVAVYRDWHKVFVKRLVLLAVALGLLTIFTLTVSQSIQASNNNIYVAPSGRNYNPGTIDQPLKTIQAAVDRARAGDTVYIRDGTYVEAVRVTRSGTSSSPIRIKAYPGEAPVIDGRAGVDCLNCGLPSGPIAEGWVDPRSGKGFNWNSLVAIQGDHVIFEGFVVKRSMGRGITVWRDESIVYDVTVRNNQVLDSRNTGILYAGEGTQNGHVENNLVWHSGSFAPWVDGRDSSIVDWPGAIQIKRGNNISVRGNNVYENWTEGITADHSKNVTMEDNIVHDNFALQIYVHRVENLTVQRNLVYHTNNPDWRRGGDPSSCIVVNNESQFNGSLVTNNIDIINNVAVGCRLNFAVWGGSDGLGFANFLVAHNLFVNAVTNDPSDKAQAIVFSDSDYSNFKFENNIVYQGITSEGHEVGFADPGVSYAYNLWYPRRPENGKGAGTGDLVGQDPEFVDHRAYELPENWSQEPDGYWFQIESGSPVIDRGKVSQPFLPDTDIIIDLFFGLRDSDPDMGVHEYGSEPAGKNFIPMINK